MDGDDATAFALLALSLAAAWTLLWLAWSDWPLVTRAVGIAGSCTAAEQYFRWCPLP